MYFTLSKCQLLSPASYAWVTKSLQFHQSVYLIIPIPQMTKLRLRWSDFPTHTLRERTDSKGLMFNYHGFPHKGI